MICTHADSSTVNSTEGITYSEASLRSLMAAKSSPGGFAVATITNPGSFMATITHPTGNGYCRDRILRDKATIPFSHSKMAGIKEIASDGELRTELSIAGDSLLLVDFFATWCGPCREIAPKLVQLQAKYKKVIFLKVDIDKCSVSCIGTMCTTLN